MKQDMLVRAKQINWLNLGKFIVLFFGYVVIFILFYAVGVYSLDAFQSVGISIQSWPLPSIIRSIIILSWMTIPIGILLNIVNLKYVKLNLKLFLICTISFILIAVLTLELLLLII